MKELTIEAARRFRDEMQQLPIASRDSRVKGGRIIAMSDLQGGKRFLGISRSSAQLLDGGIFASTMHALNVEFLQREVPYVIEAARRAFSGNRRFANALAGAGQETTGPFLSRLPPHLVSEVPGPTITRARAHPQLPQIQAVSRAAPGPDRPPARGGRRAGACAMGWSDWSKDGQDSSDQSGGRWDAGGSGGWSHEDGQQKDWGEGGSGGWSRKDDRQKDWGEGGSGGWGQKQSRQNDWGGGGSDDWGQAQTKQDGWGGENSDSWGAKSKGGSSWDGNRDAGGSSQPSDGRIPSTPTAMSTPVQKATAEVKATIPSTPMAAFDHRTSGAAMPPPTRPPASRFATAPPQAGAVPSTPVAAFQQTAAPRLATAPQQAGAVPSTPAAAFQQAGAAPSTPVAAFQQTAAPSTPMAAFQQMAAPGTPAAAFQQMTAPGPAAQGTIIRSRPVTMSGLSAPGTPRDALSQQQAAPGTPRDAFASFGATAPPGAVPSTPGGMQVQARLPGARPTPALAGVAPSTPSGNSPGTPGASRTPAGMGMVPSTPGGAVPGTPSVAPGTPTARHAPPGAAVQWAQRRMMPTTGCKRPRRRCCSSTRSSSRVRSPSSRRSTTGRSRPT
ncbi:unnamed protein product [Prorocentrum cordatum]|uniref:Uncharacterized protein n=1 Tax=Prorocentrum cordatum TaxID=2364126 RepID=A0ABN9VY17_9DINO|nr:unnamed protein product [Polarella glacialis]